MRYFTQLYIAGKRKRSLAFSNKRLITLLFWCFYDFVKADLKAFRYNFYINYYNYTP